MCLAVPMKVIAVNPDGSGSGEIEGVVYEVNLSLIDQPQIDDYVIVHAGFAIEKLDQQEASERIAMFKKLEPTSDDSQ